MEVATLIAAHKFDDLESDIKSLVDEIHSDDSDAAAQGLLHLVSEATVRFNALRDDYVQWRSGSKISPQVKIRFSRHIELFHKVITKATIALKRVGYTVECPPFPHTPNPAILVTPVETEVASTRRKTSSTAAEGGRTSMLYFDTNDSTMAPGISAETGKTLSPQNTNLLPTSTQNSNPSPGQLSSSTSHQFRFPDVQVVGDVTKKCSVSLAPLSTNFSDAECRAKEANLDASEARECYRSASRMEEEERLKAENDKRVEEDEREERELLRRADEVRRRREAMARLGQERLERVRREEKELYENLQAQNNIIRHELKRNVSPPR